MFAAAGATCPASWWLRLRWVCGVWKGGVGRLRRGRGAFWGWGGGGKLAWGGGVVRPL